MVKAPQKKNGKLAITAGEIESVLHLKQIDAAAKLGISVCTLKRYFSKHKEVLGRKRWPYTPSTGGRVSKQSRKRKAATKDITRKMASVSPPALSPVQQQQQSQALVPANSMMAQQLYQQQQQAKNFGQYTLPPNLARHLNTAFMNPYDLLQTSPGSHMLNVPTESFWKAKDTQVRVLSHIHNPTPFCGDIHNFQGEWNDPKYLKLSNKYPMALIIHYDLHACNRKFLENFEYTYQLLGNHFNLMDDGVMVTVFSREFYVRNCILFMKNPKVNTITFPYTCYTRTGREGQYKITVRKAGIFIFVTYYPIDEKALSHVHIDKEKYKVENKPPRIEEIKLSPNEEREKLKTKPGVKQVDLIRNVLELHSEQTK